MTERVTIYFDGACEPTNPKGIASYGFVVYDKDGNSLFEGKGIFDTPFSENSTNNTAEYTGIIKALSWIIENGLNDRDIIVKGDSQLAIRQLNGFYSVKSPKLIPLFRKTQKIIKEIKKTNTIHFKWIPREKNEVADYLSHEAYEELLDESPELRERIHDKMATEKQKIFMDKLGIQYDSYIGRREASRLISRCLKKNNQSR